MFLRRYTFQGVALSTGSEFAGVEKMCKTIIANMGSVTPNKSPINPLHFINQGLSRDMLLFAAGVAIGVGGIKLYQFIQLHLAVDSVYFDINREIKEKNALSISLIELSRPLGTKKEFSEYSNSLF